MKPKAHALAILLPVLGCLAATAIIGLIFSRTVDLQPQVDQSFFFSSHDPQLRTDNAIDREFPEPPEIILAASGDIRSPSYAERIQVLTDELARLPGATGVQSLSREPKDIDDALNSPLWSRLLVAPDQHSTYLFVSFREEPGAEVITQCERIRQRNQRPGFTVAISGVPYVTALIGRNLARDLRVFSLSAVGVFGIVLLIIFRSGWVLLGTFVACADSSAATLILNHLVRIPIGPLTANLSTMVFVMTLSPIVFLTFNHRIVLRDGGSPGREAVRDAVKRTVVPSFWSSTCMLLGFISLLFVPSTPMRHLGIAGSIGAVMAFTAAYTVYPWFIVPSSARRDGAQPAGRITRWLHEFFSRRHGVAVAVLAAFALSGALGLLRLNTDPSLPSYFKPGGDIRTGLEFIDRNGGSSPLKLVVEDQHHAELKSDEAYHRLMALQESLEHDPAVGSVLSLGVVLAQAKRPLLAHFVSTSHLIRILDTPKYGEVSRELISADRTRTLFLLRMHETRRTTARAAVIARLRTIVEQHGFHTVQVGGTYSQLNQMSRLLTSSIISGVLLLIGIFALMGLAFSRSLRIAGAMLASLVIIPVVVRGYIAWLGMPLDFITASAANIDLGMGVDAMIYLTMAARRAGGGHWAWDAWSTACSELWRPIGTSLLVICSGFGIFLVSSFPPTQRFGLFVIFGSATAASTALFVFPWLAAGRARSKR
ncbi:MAG TPA: MMPL family transporter [Gemmatimonadales bacterium]|jgi:predicted RND superfamily exporter protein